MAASHVESWKDSEIGGHHFQGFIDGRDLTMQPREVVERVKHELILSIVNRIMTEIGPRLDEAIVRAWERKSE
jgi:hypothetical protein